MAAKSKIYGVTADHLPIKSNCIGPDMTKGADKRLVRADGSQRRGNQAAERLERMALIAEAGEKRT